MDENFIVDFGEVTRVITEDFNKLNNRPSYAGELMTGDTDIPQVPSSVSELNNDSNYQTGAQVSEAIGTETEAREAADTALDGRLTTVEGIAATALQPSSIDKVVMTDINVGANTSTTTFNLDASKQNLLTGATSSKQVSMPVASSTEAGIMNSATFDAVVNNTANINALANGAVAITGLPSSPTQTQLTTAWENATGETSLMNRAGIYDVTNEKVWTYYTNDTTWHSTTNTTQVTINTFTNSSEGTIKGSTNVGQVFAEADGTGSVNGWDALNDVVGNSSSAISGLQTAVDGKQDKLIAGTNINIAADGKTISATDTTYTSGNAIDITNGEISADIHPADFFTASDSISDCGSNLSLDNTIATTLKSVEVKGDTFQQTYSGKNLINGSYGEISQTVRGTAEASGNGFKITSTSSSGATYVTVPIPNIASLLGQTVTVSYVATGDGIRARFFYLSAAGGATSGIGSSETVTLPDSLGSDSGIGVVFYTSNNESATYNDIQLELGSTATQYEQYVGGIPAPNPDYPQDVQVVTGEQTVKVTGKNLLPLGTGSYTNHGFTMTYNEDGSITATGTADATYVNLTRGLVVNYEQGKTFTLSIKEPLSYTFGVILFGAGTTREDINITAGSTSNNKTLAQTHTTATLAVYGLTVGQSYSFTVCPMLEEGSTATAYEPYQSQSYTISLGSIELCKIGDYQDYIYKSGDDWYMHKEIGKVVLDGSETWSAANMTNNWVYYTTNAGMAVVASSQMPNIISNYFSVTTTDGQWTSVAGSKSVTLNNAASPNTQIRFTVGDSTNKLADFKTWLSTHNTIIYYPLATPTDTKITDATLVGQLEALAGAMSYNNQTNVVVTATGENLPATLCVEAYRKSLNGLLGVIERLGE